MASGPHHPSTLEASVVRRVALDRKFVAFSASTTGGFGAPGASAAGGFSSFGGASAKPAAGGIGSPPPRAALRVISVLVQQVDLVLPKD